MGLSPGVPVAAGLIDAHAGALGTIGGALGAEPADPRRRLALILGTSSCCMALSDEARFVPGVWGPLYDGLTPGQWLTEGGQSAFGAAIDRLLRMHPAFAGRSFETLEREILARCGCRLGGRAARARSACAARFPRQSLALRRRRSARGGMLGLDLDEDETSLQALYVAGLVRAGAGAGAGHAGAGGRRLLLRRAGGERRRRARARWCARSSPTSAAGASSPPRPRSRCCSARRCSARSPPGATILRARCARCRGSSEITEPAGGDIAALHARKRSAFETLQRAERDIRAARRR